MATGSNLSSVQSDYFFVNDVDYQVPLEEAPDVTRGPVFFMATVLIGAVLVLIMLVCGLGNCLFIVSLVRSGRLRTLTEQLVAQLALSDALVALCCPLLLDYYTVKALSWDHGLGLCAATNYLRTLSLHVSTNALLFISLDRYQAIVFPLRPRLKRSGAIVLGVWLVPALVSVPVALKTSEIVVPVQDGLSKTFCAQVWTVDHRVLYQTYFLLVLVFQFLFPVVVMTMCYAQVCRELWSKVVPGFQTEQIRRRLQRRRRTVVVLVLVLMAYVVCWAPYYGFTLLRDFYPTLISRQRNALVAFYVIECLAMSNGVINTLCFVNVQHRSSERLRNAARFPIKLRTFIRRRSSGEENWTMSTRATDTERTGPRRPEPQTPREPDHVDQSHRHRENQTTSTRATDTERTGPRRPEPQTPREPDYVDQSHRHRENRTTSTRATDTERTGPRRPEPQILRRQGFIKDTGLCQDSRGRCGPLS